MSECKLDHTYEDVMSKFESQRNFIPESLALDIERFLQTQELNQAQLNEWFHLLKKYDLATSEEQHRRNQQMITLIQVALQG